MKLKRFFILVTILMLFAVPSHAANLDKEYENALKQLQTGNYADAAQSFSALGYYEDASLMAMYCAALNAGESGLYATAVGNFESLGNFRDAALQAKYYAALYYEEAEAYEDAYELLDTMTLFRDASARVVTYPAKILDRDYRSAAAKEAAGNLEGALSAFKELIPYSDSADRAAAVQEKIYARDYAAADAMETAGQLESALSAFKALGSYSDCPARVAGVEEKIRQRDYAAADKAEQEGDYAAALTGFTALGNYLDSAQRAANVQDKGNYALGLQHANSGNFSKAYEIFTALGDYEDSAEKAYALGVTTFATVKNRYNGVAAFEFHDLWGVINVNTNTAVSPYWDEIGYFNEHGLAKVKKDGQYGYINTQGQVVVPCQWYEVSDFKNGFCTVTVKQSNNYLFGLYDAQGKQITPANWRTLGSSYNSNWNPSKYFSNYAYTYAPAFSDGKIKVQNTDGLWGFIDERGQQVGKVEWSSIADFSEGLAAVTNSAGKVGFIDDQGNVIIAPQYDAALRFSEGLAAVRVGDYWCYIDRNNNVVISANYTQANSFSGGRTDVFLEGIGWQIINNRGGLLYFINEQTVADYNAAVQLMDDGKYLAAREIFLSLSGYRDSTERAELCVEKHYDAAMALKNDGKYNEAITAFNAIKTHEDSAAQIKVCETAILDGKYDAAMAVKDAGKYADAYEAFVALNGYKDSAAQASAIAGKAQAEKLAKATVGSYVTFGAYEQDNKTSNGKEAIEWLVLAKENNRMLVISRYALDCKPYNTEYTSVTWETCTLRTWLNKDFLNAAFSSAEQAMIPTMTVSADKNPSYSTDPGKATQDKVFLLSIVEANKYFKTDSARQCKTTAYAKAQGADTKDGGFGYWWLRSPGYIQNCATYVLPAGGVYDYGYYVYDGGNVIRPALWINLEP